jgi:hypothetical protein
VEPGSNAAGRFEALSLFRAQLVDVNISRELDWLDRLVAHVDRGDLRWLSAPARLWRADAWATAGDPERALNEVTANLGAIERGFLGAPNYPSMVHGASQIL